MSEPLREPLVVAFEEATLDPAKFHHREHLFVAWCYLRALPLEEALARFAGNLRRLVNTLGVPQKFHATVTWGYFVLVDEAMQRTPGAGFDELLVVNPALLEKNSGALLAYYERAQLDSPEARARFVLPKRTC
jgi:hypothetical protein